MSPFATASLLFLAANLYIAGIETAEWENRLDEIKYVLHSRSGSWYIVRYGDLDALEDHDFDASHKTIVYIHGWLESAKSRAAEDLVNAYLGLMDCNVIVVDWGPISHLWYFTDAAPSTVAVGKHVAKTLLWMEKNNVIDISNLHVIGFSLGAHAAGFVGKALKPRKISRITGLDPAKPGFEGRSRPYRLSKSDAEFVDVIHTNTGLLGISNPIGHADFYPDGGEWQGNCQTIFLPCHHIRAVDYYIQSIAKRTRFWAKKCDDFDRAPRDCHGYKRYCMGHRARSQYHGIFYVKMPTYH